MADGTLSPVATPPALVRETAASGVDLRPLTTSELIDRGFSLYRAHFAGFLLLALLCQSAPLLGDILVTTFKLRPTPRELLEIPPSLFSKMGVVLALFFAGQLVGFCFKVILTFFIADAYLGKIPSVKESLRKFKSRLIPSIWTCVLNRIVIGLICLLPITVFVGAYFYALFHPAMPPFALVLFCGVAGVLLVVSIAPVLIGFMRLLMLTVPALALEGYSGWKAIGRSSDLVRYDPGLGIFYWGEMRLSFLLLPLFIIQLLILSLTSLPLTIHQAGEFLSHGSNGELAPPPDSIMILCQILTFLAGSLILPLYAIATTLFYYDIRIRREGFDIEFMAKQLGGGK